MRAIVFHHFPRGLLLVALAFLPACKSVEPPTNVLLITIDTLRPDALGNEARVVSRLGVHGPGPAQGRGNRNLMGTVSGTGTSVCRRPSSGSR